MIEKLSRRLREAALERLGLWSYDSERDAISRTIQFGNFVEAFGFMTRVAFAAESLKHHPDWHNTYDRVRITLTTPACGGLTSRDIHLAETIDRILASPSVSG
jgi:4a-hydroxytetrahydrobiopterin dehydratase